MSDMTTAKRHQETGAILRRAAYDTVVNTTYRERERERDRQRQRQGRAVITNIYTHSRSKAQARQQPAIDNQSLFPTVVLKQSTG